MTKQELQMMIKNYLIHCEKIMLNSDRKKYRSAERLTALNFANDLKKLCLNAHTSMADLCQFTLMIKKHLLLLLPFVENKSYVSSLENLNQIITTCRTHLQEKRVAA